MNAVAVAAKGKGASTLVRRARAIGAAYGFGPQGMDRNLATVCELVEQHGGAATLPVTAAAVERNPGLIARYAAAGIEFAVHGLYHVDHIALPAAEQLDQLGRARGILESDGVPAVGFRAPYLRWNDATLEAVRTGGFLYDTSQAISWPVDPELETDSYRRVLGFYGALAADDHPVVPWSVDGIVRIPYCLPDDEAVVERLRMMSPEMIGQLWLSIFRRTFERGELFTLGVHPERIGVCAPGIAAVLEAMKTVRSAVWVARLDEIARWWLARAASDVQVRTCARGRLEVSVQGPPGVTVLARGVALPAVGAGGDGYLRAAGTTFELPAGPRPFVGIHPSSPASLERFLREQGYIVEIAEIGSDYTFYLRRERFEREDQRGLLTELESGAFPLVRLGRWPDGAQSALSITGDVDALTLWDYAYRILGR